MFQVCPTNCKAEFLSELWLCTAPDCSLPLLRCLQCFKKSHASADETGKIKTHSHLSFDESDVYKPFLSLIRLYEIVQFKTARAFGKTNKKLDEITWHIFSTSDIARSFESPQSLLEFFTLKELYYKRAAYFYASPSSQLVLTFNLFTDKIFNNYRADLLALTQEQQHLAFYFEQISDSNSNVLDVFLNQEQQAFIVYCDKIRQNNGIFSIEEYILSRRKSNQFNNIYFTRMFTQFLTQNYLENPSEKQIFTAKNYIEFFWENLHIFCNSAQVTNYFNEWVANYEEFYKFMKNKNMQPSLLSFRMWKNHVPQIKDPENAEKNKYFLDNFIFAFIEFAISSSFYSINKEFNYSWKDFVKYLKDYVGVSRLMNEEFVNISKYSIYFEFRVKSQNVFETLQKSEDTVFDRNTCIAYLNQTFKEGKGISKKGYKAFYATSTEEKSKKSLQLAQFVQNIEEELKSNTDQKFYKVVFNNYVKECLDQKIKPSKEDYYEFKKILLSKFDQDDVSQENDRYILSHQTPTTETTSREFSKTKIVHDINQEEENLASLEDDGTNEILCGCCNGNKDDCQAPQCQILGYCITCCL